MYNKHFVDPVEINTQAVPSFDRLGTDWSFFLREP